MVGLGAMLGRLLKRLLARVGLSAALAAALASMGGWSTCSRGYLGEDESGTRPEKFYSYTDNHGKKVYVNNTWRIPEKNRPRTRAVDLSHVSLNHPLAADLERATEVQLDSLLKSDHCVKARERADSGRVRELWRSQGHLLVIGGAALLLLFGGPRLARALGAERSVRLITFALPLLIAIGMMTAAAVRASQMLDGLQTAAQPCRPEQYQRADVPPSKRRELMEELRRTIEGTHAQRADQLEKATTVE